MINQGPGNNFSFNSKKTFQMRTEKKKHRFLFDVKAKLGDWDSSTWKKKYTEEQEQKEQ